MRFNIAEFEFIPRIVVTSGADSTFKCEIIAFAFCDFRVTFFTLHTVLLIPILFMAFKKMLLQ
ncbi:MAG: hypothetical protein BA861_03370 [Desulfobacterales bacterium S3730MH5]|nr:MAG: hypothetical protein BA861_03370 [Desulfobacterales bacterium S3730MH5]